MLFRSHVEHQRLDPAGRHALDDVNCGGRWDHSGAERGLQGHGSDTMRAKSSGRGRDGQAHVKGERHYEFVQCKIPQIRDLMYNIVNK